MIKYEGMMYGVVEQDNYGNYMYHYYGLGKYGVDATFYTTPTLSKAKAKAEQLTKLNGRKHRIVSRQVTPWVFIEEDD